MKNLVFLVLCVSFAFACKTDVTSTTATNNVQIVQGKTMGTYYRVSYMGAVLDSLPSRLDSLLDALNAELSTYIPSSVISRFNNNEDFAQIAATHPIQHFVNNFELAQEIHQVSNAYFEPSVMPLVNYWGFGYDPDARQQAIDSSKVDSLVQLVDFKSIHLDTSNGAWLIQKENPHTKIDFSAIAKGYAVDELARFLETLDIHNYLVDIGGEVSAKGHKKNNLPWVIGIATPLEKADAGEYMAALAVENMAVATSGNYRNYYEKDGVKYSHTINPTTGYPERSRLLSASIKAPNCAMADAYATACMVAGLDAAYEMVEKHTALEAYFIYSNDKGELLSKATAGFPELKE